MRTTAKCIGFSCGLLALLAALFPARAGAQEQTVRLSLAEAIAQGVQNSHRLGELDARQQASEALVQGTHSGSLPQVSLQGGYTRTNHVDEFAITQPLVGRRVIYPDEPDNVRSRVDLQWAVYSGGRVEALTRAARAEADATTRDIGAARTDLRLDIARAYWSLVTAREAVAVVAGALERVEAQLEDARAQFDSGFVPPSDVSSAEAQRSLQQALLIETRNSERVAGLALDRLVGLAPGTTIETTEPLGSPPGPLPDAGSLVEEARRTREDRHAIETRIIAAHARTEAAMAGRKPVLMAVAGVDYARPNPRIFPRVGEWKDSWDMSLNASWSLFDGGRVRAEIAGSDATERALREHLSEFDSLLDFEVRQRWFEMESSRARADASDAAVNSAAEARRVLQDRYAAGVATNTEVLDAQVVLLETELQRTRALAAVRIAAAGLDRAVGR